MFFQFYCLWWEQDKPGPKFWIPKVPDVICQSGSQTQNNSNDCKPIMHHTISNPAQIIYVYIERESYIIYTFIEKENRIRILSIKVLLRYVTCHGLKYIKINNIIIRFISILFDL